MTQAFSMVCAKSNSYYDQCNDALLMEESWHEFSQEKYYRTCREVVERGEYHIVLIFKFRFSSCSQTCNNLLNLRLGNKVCSLPLEGLEMVYSFIGPMKIFLMSLVKV